MADVPDGMPAFIRRAELLLARAAVNWSDIPVIPDYVARLRAALEVPEWGRELVLAYSSLVGALRMPPASQWMDLVGRPLPETASQLLLACREIGMGEYYMERYTPRDLASTVVARLRGKRDRARGLLGV